MINKMYDIKPDLSNISMAIIKKLNQVIDHLNDRESEEPEKSEREYCCHYMRNAIKDDDIVIRGGIYTSWIRDGMWRSLWYCPFCGARLEG